MNTVENIVSLDLEGLLAEAELIIANRKQPVKKAQVKKPLATKALEKKPVVVEPVVLPKPVALVNTYLELVCHCGAVHSFLQAQKIKLVYEMKSGRREEYSAITAWENYKELSGLPEEKRVQKISTLTCEKCEEN